MAVMQVEVVSAEKRLFSGEAREVYARSLNGEIGILPGHQPCLLALDIAPVRIVDAEGGVERVAVHHGFLYFGHNRLVILADTAEVAHEIDTERARARRQELAGVADEDEGARRARLRAEVRLDVGGD